MIRPLLTFAIFQLAALVSGVDSTASSSSPSSLLSKYIIGGSTQLKPPPEETSTLFGVSRKNVAPEDEAIYVVKRNGAKEPLEGKKVGFKDLLLGKTNHCYCFKWSFSNMLYTISMVCGYRF